MKVFTIFVCAFILLLFGVFAALANDADLHDTQKAIEADLALLKYSGYSRRQGKMYLQKAKLFAECAK